MIEANKIYCGDSLEILKNFMDESIDCVVTSPPYWSLRNYHVEHQLGNESSFEEYLCKLIDIFKEIKRILKKTGTCFVNLGDTYAGSGNGTNDYRTELSKSIQGIGKYGDKSYQGNGSEKASRFSLKEHRLRGKTKEVPLKSLCGIPERFAIRMTDEINFTRRNTIIWYKPNCVPQSVKDRFTVDFEYVFFFVKSRKYFFNQLLEPIKESSIERSKYILARKESKTFQYKNINGLDVDRKIPVYEKGRNKRCVWSIPLKHTHEDHFAAFPDTLVIPLIQSGCPENGVVLDPFVGSGTTCIIAKKLNRRYIGIDLNSNYCKIAEQRIERECGVLF